MISGQVYSANTLIKLRFLQVSLMPEISSVPYWAAWSQQASQMQIAALLWSQLSAAEATTKD
jgi:hypothetical protein